MATDFDDIFGDLKEDERFSATRTSDLDEASIFGDSPGKPESPAEVVGTCAPPAPPAAIPIHIAAAPTTFASTFDAADTSKAEISLDDDDDDDDFLEKIVENARKKASGSRESSGSALHIRSQSSARQREPAIDFDALCKAYRETGDIPAASRLAFWRHTLQAAVNPTAAVSMYALQTTPLDLPNQAVLRKEVESLCSRIFASHAYLEVLQSAATENSADGARLLFIDSAEILLTHLCKRLRLDVYPAGLALTFAPLIATSGSDPLRLELVETLAVVCQRVLPHLPKHVLARSVTDARRPLLKWLLQYHAPEVAFHLDQHFHTYRDFDFLTKVWDCCVLAESSAFGGGPGVANATAASTCMSFILVQLIASRAGKKLLRMEGEQLRHCMAQTLVDALREGSSGQLTREVQRLIDLTPPGFRRKLSEVGYAPPPSAPAPAATAPPESVTKRSSTANLGMSLISASTTGVKELSSAMIDMPTKLLLMGGALSKAPGGAAAAAEAKDDASAKQQHQLFEQISEAGDNASLAMRLAAEDVVPLVFKSFQAPIADEKIRYFIVDCRSDDELRGGQIPTAFHFDPDAVTDRQVLEHVLATLNPLKGKVHLCVMGHGYGRIVGEIREQQRRVGPAGAGSPFAQRDDLFEAYATNLTRVNSALLFLTKQGFPFVSVLDGGYAAAHSLLYHSAHLTVDDIVDHDAAQCAFCQHHRSMATPAASASGAANTAEWGEGPPSSEQKREPSGRGLGAASDGNPVAPSGTAPPATKTASGQLDAKALFDAHSGLNSSYFSSFAGALKTSGKTLMNPGDSLKDSTKWLMKKTHSTGGAEQHGKAPGTASPDAKSAGSNSIAGALPNFNKLRSSLAAMGSESLDLLKKAEQAAVGKTRTPFGGVAAVAASAAAAKASEGTASAAPGSRGTGTGPVGSGAGERNASFQRSEEEVFTIDDDDEEDDFVGGGSGASRTSSGSSARNESFNGGLGGAGPGSPAAASAFTLHAVEKGHVKLLAKGMRVSRAQMLPCVESPFFSGYKKKKLAAAGDAGPARVSMLPRRLVIAESHLVVLKAERNLDDVYLVKSCHVLSHVARMTCLKKNALMVTMYYKWKVGGDGHVVEKRNSYEVQQRDEFIKAVKGALEKM
ncbi:hypothetical protein PybrP1_002381 [[Pythium] brassicae (nom. inval.)]|nr:hypothetical protein PybrP1_002381 [[Pythium] brassicae (nom. inval.)]